MRHFLVQLAGLGHSARTEVVAAHLKRVALPAFYAADTALADTIARSGRDDARDALAGPLLQLVQLKDGAGHAAASTLNAVSAEGHGDDPLSDLDPIAEPALAAALALLVSDVLPMDAFTELYAPFASVIPVGENAR